MFVLGALVYLGVVRYAMRAKANAGMVQIFATFGLAVTIQGLAQYLFSPDYRSIGSSWLAGRTVNLAGVYLPAPQIFGAAVSLAAFAGLWLLMTRTDFGKALEATREDQGAVALVGIDRNRIFALGWGLGAGLIGLAGGGDRDLLLRPPAGRRRLRPSSPTSRWRSAASARCSGRSPPASSSDWSRLRPP